MDRTGTQDFQITEGTDVYGSDGEKVGSVVAVQPNYVVVEKGFFFPTDYYIPTSAVASYDDGRVYLSVTKDEALNQGWDAEPTGGYVADVGGTATTATTTYETDVAPVATGAVGMGAGADVARTDADLGVATTGATTTGTTRVETGETIAVPVHEEELTAVKRQREIGEVEIEKDVVAEQRTIEVPVTEERVRVERRVVDRPVDATDATAFEEGVIEVPIRGEEVELQKQVRVAEEVEIGKEAVQRTEQVTGTVRREEVHINEVDATTTGTTRTTGTTGTTVEDAGLLDSATDTVRDAGRNRTS
jgi:uncharacterized protein (TIGR02271 family)